MTRALTLKKSKKFTTQTIGQRTKHSSHRTMIVQPTERIAEHLGKHSTKEHRQKQPSEQLQEQGQKQEKEKKPKLTHVESTAKPATQPAIKPVFERARFKIFQGDCLEVLAKFPSNHIDMIFADPPYKLSNNGTTCYAGKRVSVNKGDWDKSDGFTADLTFHEQWINACKRVLKPEGTIWISGTLHNIHQCGYLLQKLNFHILNDITWFKPNAAPNLSCTVFVHSHETLLWARKTQRARHTFNYTDMKTSPFPEDKIKMPDRQMRSVWSIPAPSRSEKELGRHPTQKPLTLLKRIVRASTQKNALILDPFSGSGTTGIACEEIGHREYIGIEIDPAYIALTRKRLSTITKPPRSKPPQSLSPRVKPKLNYAS